MCIALLRYHIAWEDRSNMGFLRPLPACERDLLSHGGGDIQGDNLSADIHLPACHYTFRRRTRVDSWRKTSTGAAIVFRLKAGTMSATTPAVGATRSSCQRRPSFRQRIIPTILRSAATGPVCGNAAYPGLVSRTIGQDLHRTWQEPR